MLVKLTLLAVAMTLCSAAGNTTWLIHQAHSYGAHEYIDSTGYLKGFAYEMVQGVCASAGITCKSVWDKYSNCWQSPAGQHPFGGVGLHDEYYHVCMGWWQTVERQHVFSFSQEYAKAPKSHFYVKPGNTAFSKDDITGKKIGFISGWATDEKCLARMTDSITGAFLPAGMVVHSADADALVAQLTSGAFDAAFCSEDSMEQYVTAGTVTKIDLGHACLIGGNSAMARKDSPFPALWDAGFIAFKASGGYKTLCDNVSTTHAGKGSIDCV